MYHFCEIREAKYGSFCNFFKGKKSVNHKQIVLVLIIFFGDVEGRPTYWKWCFNNDA